MFLSDFWKASHQKERKKLSSLGKCIYSLFKHARNKDSDIRIALHNNSQRDENSVSILLEIPESENPSQYMPFNISSHVLVTILLDGQTRFSAYQSTRLTADKRTIIDLKSDDLDILYDQVIRRIVNDSTGMFDIETLDMVRAVEGKKQILHDAQTMFARFDL